MKNVRKSFGSYALFYAPNLNIKVL
ncbi:hypothetical protein THF5H11_60122 [Vibrio jasicida]|nr:hypothetical protein THF5H11_60122 [Vibrio jasicida]CAH1609141.1 hypothetical protein THF5G08_80166 [Vibrio jasicida]